MKALYLILAFLMAGCSSAPLKKAHLAPSSDPQAEYTQLEDDMRQGYSEQLTLLSPEAFGQANHYFLQAKDRLKSGSDRAETLESIAYAKGALDVAFTRALRVSALLGRVTDARKKALEAGADSYHRREFNKIDSEVRQLARELEQGDNHATLASIIDRKDFQKRYSDIELDSIYLRYLGDARKDIDQLRSNGASQKAPKTFSRLESKLRSSEESIAADRYNQSFLVRTQNDLKILGNQTREEMNDENRLPASQ